MYSTGASLSESASKELSDGWSDLLQYLTAVAWLYSEAEFLHVCNGLPSQKPSCPAGSTVPTAHVLAL